MNRFISTDVPRSILKQKEWPSLLKTITCQESEAPWDRPLVRKGYSSAQGCPPTSEMGGCTSCRMGNVLHGWPSLRKNNFKNRNSRFGTKTKCWSIPGSVDFLTSLSSGLCCNALRSHRKLLVGSGYPHIGPHSLCGSHGDCPLPLRPSCSELAAPCQCHVHV